MAAVSNKQLAELDALVAAADPAPWRVEHQPDDVESYWIGSPDTVVCVVEENEPGDFNDEIRPSIVANLALAAKARNLLPALLAELRRHHGADPAVIVTRKK